MVKKIIFFVFALVATSNAYVQYSYTFSFYAPPGSRCRGHVFVDNYNYWSDWSTSGSASISYLGYKNSHPVFGVVIDGGGDPVETIVSEGDDGIYSIRARFGDEEFPVVTKVYDFSEQQYEYNSVDDQMVTLQYYDDFADAWVDLKSFILKGKKSALDDPFIWSFGLATAPEGIEDWNIRYESLNIDPNSDFGDEWANNESGAYTYELGDGDGNYSIDENETVTVSNPTSYDINQSADPNATGGVQSPVAPTSVTESTGMNNANVNPSNTLENTAVGVAGGIKMAKGEISEAVKDGVAGLKADLNGKADDIISAINGIGSGGGATAGEIQGIVDGVGSGEALESTATEADFSDVATNINSSAGKEAIDRMSGKLEGFLGNYKKPIFPQGFGSVSSISLPIGGTSISLNFGQSVWSTLRSALVWLVYALSFFGLLKILRRGIA